MSAKARQEKPEAVAAAAARPLTPRPRLFTGLLVAFVVWIVLLQLLNYYG